MLVLTNIEEAKRLAPASIFENILYHLGAFNDPLVNFDVEFGGVFYVIERRADLESVQIIQSEENKEWLSVIEASSQVDIAEWLSDRSFLCLGLITCDTGGNIYYIPRHLALFTPSVLETYEISRTD